MKLTAAARRPRQRGLASVLVFILLTLVLALVVANQRSLAQLKREIRFQEERQLRRLRSPVPAAAATPRSSEDAGPARAAESSALPAAPPPAPR